MASSTCILWKTKKFYSQENTGNYFKNTKQKG